MGSKCGTMDHVLMQDYIERVIFPYAESIGKRLLILWDARESHWHDDVISLLQERGHEIIGIPARATSFLQPLEVSVNAPFKNALMASYETWLGRDDLPLTQQGNIKRASYDCVLDWVKESVEQVGSSTDISHAFTTCGISEQRNCCEFNQRLSEVMRGATLPNVQVTQEWWDSDGGEDDNDELYDN